MKRVVTRDILRVTNESYYYDFVKGLVQKYSHRVGVFFMVDQMGFEPMTPALQRQCSSQLSYWPAVLGRQSMPRNALFGKILLESVGRDDLV